MKAPGYKIASYKYPGRSHFDTPSGVNKMPKLTKNVSKIPLSIKVTPIQLGVLNSARYYGKSGQIFRFFLNKLINGELPPDLVQELRKELGI